MVGLGAEIDVHGTLSQVHLLVSFGAAFAVRAPAVAGLVFFFLGFAALEVIFKEELALVGGV